MEPIQTNNNLTIAELMLTTSNVIVAMERDATEFLARGINQIEIDQFKAQSDAYDDFPSDEIYQAEIGIVAEEKENLRISIEQQIRKISGYFEQKWGLKSPYYKQLGIKGYTKFRDAEILITARRVVQVATSRLADLSIYGLTQALIDQLAADAQAMEDKMNSIYEKTAERDIKTNERTGLGNAIYEQLSKYCAVGKNIWEDVNEAKYNDYVIHKTVHHVLPKVQNVVAVLSGQGLAQVTWSAAAGAAEYEVDFQSQPTGNPIGEWQERFTVGGLMYEGPILPSETNFYRVRAVNIGQAGAWSDVAEVTG